MLFSQILEKRRSTRKLSGKKIPKSKIDFILDAVRRAPSAKNLQSFKIYLVEKAEVKNELAEFSGGQGVIAQASVVLVFVAEVESCCNACGERGKLYSIQDADIACTFAWLAAVDQGLASVWIGSFNEGKVSRILKLKKGLRPIAILPLGFAAEKPSFRQKKNLNQLVEKI